MPATEQGRAWAEYLLASVTPAVREMQHDLGTFLFRCLRAVMTLRQVHHPPSNATIGKPPAAVRNLPRSKLVRKGKHLAWMAFRLALMAARLSALIWAVVLWPVTLGLWWWYERRVVQPVKLHYRNHPKTVSVLKRCPRLQKPYRPAPFASMIPAWSGHLHTWLHEFARDVPNLSFEREVFVMEDGGSVSVDFYPWPREDHAATPIMFIIHGVTGGSHTNYVRHYAQLLETNGIRPIIMNARGCNDTQLTTPLYFNCKFTGDIRHILQCLRERFPDAPLLATGFSLGANLLTIYLGEEGSGTPLSAAIAVANPFDMPAIDEHLSKQGIYNFILTKSLVNYLKRHRDVFLNHDKVDIDKVLLSKNLREFDREITCKLWGFDSVEEYYQKSSGKLVLSEIKIPMLVLNALDDPIFPETVIPYRAFYENSNLLLATTQTGGHIAWLEGWTPSGNNWADHVCVEFAHSILDHIQASSMMSV